MTARLLGYAPVEAAVDLSSREARTVTLTMEDFVPTLETVRVNAQRERALDQVGFAQRKRAGQGYYMDEDDIKRRNALMFSDVLRTAPGIKITQTMGRNMIENSRDPVRGCVNVYVDGTLWQQIEPGDVDDFVKPWELGAIEVYHRGCLDDASSRSQALDSVRADRVIAISRLPSLESLDAVRGMRALG